MYTNKVCSSFVRTMKIISTRLMCIYRYKHVNGHL